MSENRDEATGQFTPSTEGLYGREHELVTAGYTVKKDEPPAEDKIYDSDNASLREAAAELKASRGEPEEPIAVKDILDLDPKEAVTIEQAAREHSAARADIATFYDGMDLSRFADEVDAKRAEVIKGDPKVAEALGVEVPAKDDAKADPLGIRDNAKADPADAATVDAIDAMGGLDPETKKALKIPQVRQAIEQEFTRTEQVREQYSQGLNIATQMAQSAFIESFPELAALSADQVELGLAQLAQTNPPRFNAAMNMLNRVYTLQDAEKQDQQRQAQVQHQQFEAVRQQYSRASDAALGPMTFAEKAEMAEELVSYVGEYGISREQLMREAQTNLAIHHPAFQKMAADALKYQRIMKAPKSVPSKPLPPVQRPGVGRDVPRPGDNSSKIRALQAELSTATGNQALRIAAKINGLRRAS